MQEKIFNVLEVLAPITVALIGVFSGSLNTLLLSVIVVILFYSFLAYCDYLDGVRKGGSESNDNN